MIRALMARRRAAREARILNALHRAHEPLTGLELARATRLTLGSLYPYLTRLETTGWVVSEWGPRVGEYRRRYYRINPGDPA